MNNISVKTCECGCGKVVNPGNRFINGHNRIGSHLTEEHIRAISITNSGNRNPACRPEVAAKISKTLTGRNLPKEVCEKIRKGNAGKKMKPESVQKTVNTKKKIAQERGYWHTKETCQKIGLAFQGRILTEEHKKLIGKGMSKFLGVEENHLERVKQLSERYQQNGYRYKNGYIYLSNLNKKLFYRSSYERDGLLLLNLKSEVVDIEVEKVHIVYESYEGIKHYYTPDWLITLEDGHQILVEVKPQSCFESESWMRVENIQEKIDAAITWCKKRNITYCIWTEDMLYNSSSTTMSLQAIVEATVAYSETSRRYSLNCIEICRKE